MPKSRSVSLVLLALLLVSSSIAPPGAAGTPMTAGDILGYKRAATAAISPSGEWIAYTVSVPRTATDEAGRAYSEIHVVSTRTGASRPFVAGKVNADAPRWSPDGSRIAFLMARGEKAKTQVWTIPIDGGEARQTTFAETGVSAFRWHPSGGRIAYVAATPATKREKDLEGKGYGFTFFEENLKDRNLYVLEVGGEGGTGEARILTEGCSVWNFEWSPDGKTIVYPVVDTPEALLALVQNGVVELHVWGSRAETLERQLATAAARALDDPRILRIDSATHSVFVWQLILKRQRDFEDYWRSRRRASTGSARMRRPSSDQGLNTMSERIVTPRPRATISRTASIDEVRTKDTGRLPADCQ